MNKLLILLIAIQFLGLTTYSIVAEAGTESSKAPRNPAYVVDKFDNAQYSVSSINDVDLKTEPKAFRPKFNGEFIWIASERSVSAAGVTICDLLGYQVLIHAEPMLLSPGPERNCAVLQNIGSRIKLGRITCGKGEVVVESVVCSNPKPGQ